MAEERYYLAEKVKERFMVDAFNTDVIMQRGNMLKMLSSKVIKPEEHGIKLIKGVVSCTGDYKIKEATKEEAMKTLEEIGVNYFLWGRYMSGSDNCPSRNLSGPGGEILF